MGELSRAAVCIYVQGGLKARSWAAPAACGMDCGGCHHLHSPEGCVHGGGQSLPSVSRGKLGFAL